YLPGSRMVASPMRHRQGDATGLAGEAHQCEWRPTSRQPCVDVDRHASPAINRLLVLSKPDSRRPSASSRYANLYARAPLLFISLKLIATCPLMSIVSSTLQWYPHRGRGIRGSGGLRQSRCGHPRGYCSPRACDTPVLGHFDCPSTSTSG